MGSVLTVGHASLEDCPQYFAQTFSDGQTEARDCCELAAD